MDYTTSKAFVIGFGIFVTLTIAGSFILILSTVSDIYNATENTNTSIVAQYDNVYSMYAGAELNALNLMNTLRKYENDTEIRVGIRYKNDEEEYFGASNKQLLNELTEKIVAEELSYEKMFKVSVKEKDLIIQIVFNEV